MRYAILIVWRNAYDVGMPKHTTTREGRFLTRRFSVSINLK